MFGGANKSGRGGGAGGGGGRGGAGGKRNLLAPQNPIRASSGAGGRLSMGGSGPRGRNPPPSAAAAQSAAVDESFSLVSRSPLSFAATLRLPPDLVEEIKRVEAQGGAAKIKFDTYPNNPSGNVIDVGGKEFRFTWSREMGDLCDIYEEPKNDEGSNGLLVESGCAYRKLNVQRTLDESTKNHLKMRSEEADRKSKARKTVVLDTTNPSMKSQMKALAAVDASSYKNFNKQKKEPPFKKRKFETNQAGGPPKMVHKSGFPSASSARGRHSNSPQPSTPVQSVSLASPSVAGNSNKTPANTGAATPINATGDDNVIKPEKDARGKSFPGVPETTASRTNESSVLPDLQCMLTSLLKDNPDGMSLKALEKAVGDVFPSSSRKIEAILKKIATCHAPGRYLLNSETEGGTLKTFPQSGSSPPEGNGHQVSVFGEKHHDMASEKIVASLENSPGPHTVEQAALEELLFGEEVDIDENIDATPDAFGDKNNEGQAARSIDSGSGSDSDSDSSDSGSDSGSQSRSRSRSPAGSGSGSSSDSDSDSSSNSKEGSDEDVNILSDDENEPKHEIQAPDQGFPTSPGEDVDIDGDQDIDIVTALELAPNAVPISTEEFRSTLPNQEEHEEHGTTDTVNEPEDIVPGGMRQENQDRVPRSKGKSKKALDMKKVEEAFDHGKRSKTGSYAEPPAAKFQEFLFSDSPHRTDKLNEGQYKDSNLEMEDRYDKDDNVDLASERDYDFHVPGKMVVEPHQSGRRPSLWSHDSDSQDKSGKHARSDNIHETPGKPENKMHRNKHDEKASSSEKANRKGKESGSGNKHAPQPNSLQRKHPDQMFPPDANMGLSQQDGDRVGVDAERFPPVPGRNNMLRRELSDLELGELREPLPAELDGNNNQFLRQGLPKKFDTKGGTSDSVNVYLNKGKPAGKPITVPSPPVKGMGNGSSKRSPSLHDETFENNVVSTEGYGETHKKLHSRRQNDSKQEHGSISGKGTKSQKSNPSAKEFTRVRDAFSNDGHNDSRKSESSSDENSSFSKYEKEKPDLKESIKDLVQYKEYVQEYTEKYSTYCSLDKVLENYRNEFQKMGKDLESAKSKDRKKYNRILRQLRDSYQQHGEKHKRLKKIFVVLHEELKHLKQRIKDFAAAYSKD